MVVVGPLGADGLRSAGGRLARFEQATRHRSTEEQHGDQEGGERRVAPGVYVEEEKHDGAS